MSCESSAAGAPLLSLSASIVAGLLLSTLMLAPTMAEADTYTWVDANGVVNYSERKPRGVPESRIRVMKSRGPGVPSTPAPAFEYEAQSSNTPSSNAGQQTDLSEDQQAMLQDLQATEAARQEQVAKIRADNCERSRRVLSNLTSMGRIRVTSAEGENRVMPEDERNRRIEEAQRGIAENCTG